MEKIILIGGGGHCVSCIDVIESAGLFAIEGILDVEANVGKTVSGYKIIGSDKDISPLTERYGKFLVTIGQIKQSSRRKEIFNLLSSLDVSLPFVISPYARVSSRAKIGSGTVVMHGACVNAGAEIGANCIINTAAVIEHDTFIGDHCHVSTGCIINGGCRVGESTFLGSNSVISSQVTIAPHTIIGAGSVVIKDINRSGTYVGNPARGL